MWVIFEGLDKAGKTTLEWEFLKATNFKHLVVDRGPVGYKVFDKLLGRDTKLGDQEFIHQARKIMKNKDFMVVYVHCDEAVAEKRLKGYSETCPYDYNKAQKMLKDNIRRYYDERKVLDLDTSEKSIEECVELIVEKLEEVQKGEL